MKRFLTLALSFLSIIILSVPGSSWAVDCTVDNSSDADPGSLRDCIGQADSDGDVVTIASSVTAPITLTSGDLVINAGISIQGAGSTVSVIDGSGNNNQRIFSIAASAVSRTINISGVALQGASPSTDAGAAIFVGINNTLNLSNCLLEDNTSGLDGGAVYADSDTGLNVDHCEFRNNAAINGTNGGAIYSEGRLFIYDTLFAFNSTEDTLLGKGGALYLPNGSEGEIYNSTFLSNTADGAGGAIYFESVGHDLTIDNSTFDHNIANQLRGGAIHHERGNLLVTFTNFFNNHALADAGGAVQTTRPAIIDSCLFVGNSANDTGGALHNDGPLNLSNSLFDSNVADGANGGALTIDFPAEVQNCTFVSNLALVSTTVPGRGGRGGAVYVDNGPSTLVNSTFFGNFAEGNGGGLYFETGTEVVTVNNLTIASNTAEGSAGGIYNDGSDEINLANTIIAGNIDVNGDPDCFNSGSMNAIAPLLIQNQNNDCNVASNPGPVVNDDPLLASALAPNGGPGIGRDAVSPTLTVALTDTSPALDVGDDATCEPADQRGTVRQLQGAHCDLGAYEFGPSADLSDLSLDFGEQAVDTVSTAQIVTLTNPGQAPLLIFDISLLGTDAGDFTVSHNCGTSLAAGAACSIVIQFTPHSEGNKFAGIVVDSSANVQAIQLSGVGVTAPPQPSPTPGGNGGGNPSPGDGGVPGDKSLTGGGCSLTADAKVGVDFVAFFLMASMVAGLWMLRSRSHG
ncbi:MAG TPA: hypothetical protein DF383_10685 [Deltaproteobacteria bacterium]|nr:hypothetical protein [Deltaproteobacteria bacterium]